MNVLSLLNFDKHAADVVGVAIGVNLLLPAASKILKPLAEAFDASPERAVLRFFKKDRGYCSDYDIQAISVCQRTIEREKGRTTINRLRWQFLEILFAVAGILLLWAGLVDHIGWWSILLFIPAAIVCCVSAWVFVSWSLRMFLTILCVKWFVRMRRKLVESEKAEKVRSAKNEDMLKSIGDALAEAEQYRRNNPPSAPPSPRPANPDAGDSAKTP